MTNSEARNSFLLGGVWPLTLPILTDGAARWTDGRAQAHPASEWANGCSLQSLIPVRFLLGADRIVELLPANVASERIQCSFSVWGCIGEFAISLHIPCPLQVRTLLAIAGTVSMETESEIPAGNSRFCFTLARQEFERAAFFVLLQPGRQPHADKQLATTYVLRPLNFAC